MIDIKKYLTNLLPTEDETLIRDLNTYSKSIPLEKELDFADSGLPIKILVGAHLKVENIESNRPDSREFLGKLTQDNHYLTHGLEVSANMVAGHSGDQIKAALETATFLHTFYGVKHHGNTQLGNAIKADWSVYKTFFKKGDVQKLEKGNILGIEWEGNLNASAAFSWSNAVGRSLNSISRLLNYSGLVDVTVFSGITIGFDVSIKDHYILAVKRISDDQYHLKVLKNKKRSRAFSLTAGLEVEFSEPDQAGDLISSLAVQLIEKISKKTESEIVGALQIVDQNNEDIQDKQLVELIIERMPDSIKRLTNISLTEKYEKYKNFLSVEIEKRVKENIKTTLSFQYSRVKESEEMLSCKMNLETLLKFHSQLRIFNVRTLLKDIMAGNSAIVLISYLKMKSILVRRSWGLSINLLGFRVRYKRPREQKLTTRTQIEGRQQVNDHQTFVKTAVFGRRRQNWGLGIQADMPAFSVDKIPRLDEFKFHLTFFQKIEAKISREHQLRRTMDTAFLWGGYKKDDIDSLIKTIFAEVRRKDIEVNVQLQFSDSAIRYLINRFGDRNFDYRTDDQVLTMLGKAFASALPYWNTHRERWYPEERTRIYGGPWRIVLEGNHTYHNFAENNEIAIIDYGEGYNRSMTLQEFIDRKGRHQRVKKIFNGFKMLRTGIEERKSHRKNYNPIIKNLLRMHSESLYFRSFGKFFANVLTHAKVTDYMKFTATVSFKDNEGREVERILVGNR